MIDPVSHHKVTSHKTNRRLEKPEETQDAYQPTSSKTIRKISIDQIPAPGKETDTKGVPASGAKNPGRMSTSEAARKLVTGKAEDASLVLWQRDVGGRILTPPGVGPDGALYVVNDDGLTALGPDGARRWTVSQEGINIFSTPAVDRNGTVYVGGLGIDCEYAAKGTYNGLFAYDREGRLLWEKKIGEVRTPPTIGPDGTIYAATIGGKLYAFSSDGEQKWEYDAGEKIHSYPSIGRDGTIYIATQCGPLHAVTPGGKLKWQQYGDNFEYFESFTGIGFTPDGDLLGTMWNSHLRAMDSQGNTKWLFGAFTEKRVDELPAGDRKEALKAGNVGMSTTPVTSPDGKTIYVGGTCGKFMAIDSDGHLKWSIEPGEDIHGNNVLVGKDGTVYVISGRKGTAFALDPSGEVKWKYETKERNSCQISLHENTVFLSTRSGDIYALNEEALSKGLNQQRSYGDEEKSVILDLGEGWITIGGIRLEKHTSS